MAFQKIVEQRIKKLKSGRGGKRKGAGRPESKVEKSYIWTLIDTPLRLKLLDKYTKKELNVKIVKHLESLIK